MQGDSSFPPSTNAAFQLTTTEDYYHFPVINNEQFERKIEPTRSGHQRKLKGESVIFLLLHNYLANSSENYGRIRAAIDGGKSQRS